MQDEEFTTWWRIKTAFAVVLLILMIWVSCRHPEWLRPSPQPVKVAE